MEAFLRQTEAWQYVNEIGNPKERLLAQIALATALSLIARDQEHRQKYGVVPVDLLLLARTLHSLFQRERVIKGVWDGTITSIDDLDPFPKDI